MKSIYNKSKLNQLTSYTKQNKNTNPIITLNYTYDGLNRRVKKEQIKTNRETNQTTKTITKYLYDQNSNIIALLDKDNNLKATIIHNDSIDTPLAIMNHKNHLNTILFLTDDNQNIVEEFTYKNAYGEIKEYTIHEQTLNPYSYTSRENDTDTLYYYRARYYDPTIKMFISEDPIRYDSGDFNWYRYVSNSPVMYGDAWGLESNGGKFIPPKTPLPYCFIVAGVETKIDFCEDFINKALYDFKYDQYCKTGDRQACKFACVANNFYENLKKYCILKIKKPKIKKCKK